MGSILGQGTEIPHVSEQLSPQALQLEGLCASSKDPPGCKDDPRAVADSMQPNK